MCGETPRWALDLVIALQRWEDEGHQLTPDSKLAEVKAACHSDWLALVPKDVRACARAIVSYNRQLAPTPADRPPAHGE